MTTVYESTDFPMTTVYESTDFRLTIETDNDPQNPREWDNYTTMVCAHNRYSLGDESVRGIERHRDWELYLKENILDGVEEDDVIWLPLYLYDHSGITISTTPFSSRWDSGQVGWIYAHKDDLMEFPGVYEDNTFYDDRAYEALKNEVKTYDQYLTGQVYGYTLEKREKCHCCNHVTYDELDSCWSIYADSEDEATRFIVDMLPEEADGLVDSHNIIRND